MIIKKVNRTAVMFQEPYAIYTDPKIIPKGSIPRDNYGPVTVPDDAVFVMGDNRDQSYDSRFWGFLEKAEVKGKAYTIYWSWDKEKFKVRWNRIGQRIE
jgi:signal peptidase I